MGMALRIPFFDFVVQDGGHIGFDKARCDGVHGDAARGEFFCD